jgi:glutaredoxin-like YruB-family protein
MKKVTSYEELLHKLPQKEKAYLLLYKEGNEQSDCAYKNIETALSNNESVSVFSADVATVRDIHVKYGISSVPSLMIFEQGEYIRTVKGCHDSSYYKSIIQNAIYQAKARAEGKLPKRVTVYSTPSCSWCNTLKSWLKRNGIHYTDVDVSRDEREAQALVRRSGQQGVPQTEINGQIIVGFNEQRLKTLLEI